MPDTPVTTPVWFITGCSTGLGRALAERVLQAGDRCGATARNSAQIADLAASYPDTALALAQEVAPLGIRVTLVEPGPFRTDFMGRSMTYLQNPIDAYAGTAGARRAQLQASSGKQAGDPVRAADAIIFVAKSPNPPLHLVLGKNALDRVRAKCGELLSTMDTWEKAALAADFPEA